MNRYAPPADSTMAWLRPPAPAASAERGRSVSRYTGAGRKCGARPRAVPRHCRKRGKPSEAFADVGLKADFLAEIYFAARTYSEIHFSTRNFHNFTPLTFAAFAIQ